MSEKHNYKIFDGNKYSDENSIYIKCSSSYINELKYLIGDINAYSFVDMYESLQGSKRKEWLTPQETIDVINHFYNLELEYVREAKEFTLIDIFEEMNLIIKNNGKSSKKFNNPNFFTNIKFSPFSFHIFEKYIIDMQLQDYFNYLFNDLKKEGINNG